jgi:hypothetical protein
MIGYGGSIVAGKGRDISLAQEAEYLVDKDMDASALARVVAVLTGR